MCRLHFNEFTMLSRVTFESFSVQDRYINGTPKSCRISTWWRIIIETRGNKHRCINLLNGRVTRICARNFAQTEGAPYPEDCIGRFYMHSTECALFSGKWCDIGWESWRENIVEHSRIYKEVIACRKDNTRVMHEQIKERAFIKYYVLKNILT